MLKRRHYPLAFKEDAANEDIVSAMQGKLCHAVFLERNREHSHPCVVYDQKTIFDPIASSDEESEASVAADMSIDSQEQSKEKSSAKKSRQASLVKSKSLITKWIKTDSGEIQ